MEKTPNMNDDKNRYDLVIKGGRVISFEPDEIRENVNVGIINGKIFNISTNELPADKTIDARGKYVCPGFIDFHSHISGRYFSAECAARQGATTSISGERNFEGSLIRNIIEHGFLINQGFYVSHSFTLRRAVGCRDINAPATKAEIKDMKTLARQFFINGAFGIHFGLEHTPGVSTEELIELSSLAKEYNRVVLVHTRHDGNDALMQFSDVENIIKETNASIHLLHLSFMIAFNNVIDQALEIIHQMRDSGGDITADTGLYSSYPACLGSPLFDGNWHNRYARPDKEFSEENVLIASGLSAGEYFTKERFLHMREKYPSTLIAVFACDEPAIKKIVTEPYVFISSNAADGPHYEGAGHPASAGTFPKLIRKYVREDKELTLLDAIYKLTWGPAKRLHLTDKGNLKEGYDGDIVIFDYDKIYDMADYPGLGDPNASPKGIEYVIVNGKVICEFGDIKSNSHNGQLLRCIM